MVPTVDFQAAEHNSGPRDDRLFSTPAAEWRAHWPLVLAATVGMSFHSVMSHGLGLFMGPLQNEFGWSRGQISLGLTIAAMLSLPLSPIVGAMVDRWGSRRLALPGVILSAGAIALFSTLSGSVAQWLSLWLGYALVAMLLKTTIWSAAVSSTFNASRGLALAFALSGTAIAQVLVPPLAQYLIADFGWRTAYAVLGIGWGSLTFILLFLFFFDARDRRRLRREASTGHAEIGGGLGFREAFRNVALIRIAAATLISCLLNIAILVHQVPILVESGIARENAAYLASLAGVAGIIGKIVTGWLLDRVNGGWIGGVSLSLPAVGFLLILEPMGTSAAVVLAMVLIGYAAGTSLQICAYLTTRYGGMRNFGKIFGVMASLIAVGGGLGPTVAAIVHDTFGSYVPLLLVSIPASVISGLLIVGLGPYPDWTEATKADA
jgi:predicted MFS family arabinose efflux permease